MGFYQLRGLVFCYLWQIIANIPNLQNEIVMWITFLPLSIVRAVNGIIGGGRIFARYSLYKDNGEIPQRDGGSSASDKHRPASWC